MDTNDQQATSALFEKACQCRTSNAFARCRGRTLHKRRHRAATGCTVQHGADGRGAGTRAELGAGADRRVGRGACRGPQRDAGQRLYVGLFCAGPVPTTPISAISARTTQSMPQGAPGGFLAGAGQTAMGVAAGCSRPMRSVACLPDRPRPVRCCRRKSRTLAMMAFWTTAIGRADASLTEVSSLKCQMCDQTPTARPSALSFQG